MAPAPTALPDARSTVRPAAVGVQELGHAELHVGGSVLHGPTAEYVIHATSQLRRSGEGDVQDTIRVLENLLVPTTSNVAVRMSDVARVTLGPGPRRGVLEQDGNEVVGGVVLMRYGANPLQVIRGIRDRVASWST